MAGRTVELSVAGKRCRVVTTADEEELSRLTAMVEGKLAEVLRPGRHVNTEAMLLVAMALAHDVDEQRSRADVVTDKAKRGLQRLLQRVDTVLDGAEVEAIAGEQAGRQASSEAIEAKPGLEAARAESSGKSAASQAKRRGRGKTTEAAKKGSARSS